MDNTVALAAIGLASLALTGMFSMLATSIKATRQMAESSEKVAHETKKLHEETRKLRIEAERGNRQSEERNGHLAELVTQGTEAAKTLASETGQKIIDAVQHIQEQKVEHQTVDKQEVTK